MPPPPRNVEVSRINPTAIQVGWDMQTLVELKGLAEYVVEYSQVTSRRRESGTVIVSWTRSSTIISDLEPDEAYRVTVSTSTSVGMSGM